jgi:hypothetical protein
MAILALLLNVFILLVCLAMFVCAVMVLVKLFQKEGALKGILGLICSLYAYIWGWMNIKNEDLKLKPWMYGWTATLVLFFILMGLAVVIGSVLNNIETGLGG